MYACVGVYNSDNAVSGIHSPWGMGNSTNLGTLKLEVS
jgi:hypothetical protein